MKKEISLTVGQQVWVDMARLYTQRKQQDLRPMTVTKVGRVWVQLSAHASYKDIYRAPIGSRYIDGAGYQSPGTIYLSELEYANQCMLESVWADFRRLVSDHTGCPDLTVEQIQYMSRIVEESSK